ncbi:polyketide cyclase [Frankia sp. CcI49]|uniref:nuclear transport factor 2 family protein n=1 Tax=Frankia sp. CcI49 TaxID=1745382 RepID=UPI0009783141|nr:nuclear transport factor 2 family protein [Frankia sp. CcI49]ONH55523.1 polyketide cyclase [Frankia sp. CcI49]
MTETREGDLATRVAAIEARLDIGQLPMRYALAVDGRDVDGWVRLFVPDVRVTRETSGRDALREHISEQLSWFYRSVHQICGHRIELDSPDSARGSVYCRAELEVGDRWIVMAICYFDEYRRVEGEWLFQSRRERHWYAADVVERPQEVAFDSWPVSGLRPGLPAAFPSWDQFWRGRESEIVTSAQVRTAGAPLSSGAPAAPSVGELS